MANIIITLPGNLWWAIRHGHKMYELRKRCPKVLMNQSKVYVVKKGTTKVVGCFTIASFNWYNDYAYAWKEIGKKLFINLQWYNDYVRNHKGNICAWKIGSVYEFDNTVDLEEYFGVKHNPQSYIYTNLEPYIHLRLVRLLDDERNQLVTPSTWLRRTGKDDLPF